MTTLNDIIRDQFGSQKKLAEHIGVDEHTIIRWMKREPTHFLRYAFKMSETQTHRARMRYVAKLAAAVDHQLKTISAE